MRILLKLLLNMLSEVYSKETTINSLIDIINVFPALKTTTVPPHPRPRTWRWNKFPLSVQSVTGAFRPGTFKARDMIERHTSKHGSKDVKLK